MAAELSPSALLLAELAQAKRRRERADLVEEALRKEADELRKQLGLAGGKSAPRGKVKSSLQLEHSQQAPLISPAGLMQRSALPSEVGGLPCELWPFVFSCMARAPVSQALVSRLRQQLDEAAARTAASARLEAPEAGAGRHIIQRPDKEFVAFLIEICRVLAASLLGIQDFHLQLDEVWGIVQKEGDYQTMKAQRNKKAPHGFVFIMEVELPPSLSSENHDRPSKGSYGFHDGLHNLIWKGDRTSDQADFIQPGIIQLELVVGYLYVFPQWVQTLTYPFEGAGERKWIAGTVALQDTGQVAPSSGR
ncbi:unnamed protein product [Polarella glacialis]|uniref:Uncharacterized protein n=1 Tax=Polarella glacialis TaxID=89957 RepID=A0A813G0M9_POLGL|nr:unnamed protein product [Polarella glacialis]